MKKETKNFSQEIRALTEVLSVLDEEQALEILEDAYDQACATVSEKASVGQPNMTFEEMKNALGLDSSL